MLEKLSSRLPTERKKYWKNKKKKIIYAGAHTFTELLCSADQCSVFRSEGQDQTGSDFYNLLFPGGVEQRRDCTL